MTTTANDLVRRTTDGPIAILTLNRPDKGNALSESMMDALEDGVRDAVADPGIRVIVLAAEGKVFCAGHDLAEMTGHDDKAYFEALFARCARLMSAIRRSPKPVIAKVQGAAVAAGCQLVATCDLAYAVETAKFGVNGINLGLFCATPSVALARAVPAKQALDLLLTGRLIPARRAAEIGLLSEAVPPGELDRAVKTAADLIAAKLPDAVALGKDLFHRQIEMDTDAAYGLAGERMAENIGFPATRELIEGFLKKH